MKDIIKIKFTKAELNWIERTADIETSRIFENFNQLIKKTDTEKITPKAKELIDKQVNIISIMIE